MNQTPLSTSYTDSTSSILSKSSYAQGAGSAALSKISTGAQTLPEGSTLNAKVMDFLGRDLTLKLADGSVLHANSSTAVPLSIGQSAEFTVLRSTGEQLLLKLVSETPQEASASLAGRALDAAGLPVNEGNLNLVNTLLANRMPVNAENLQALVRESNMYPAASPETLVMMHKHEMPINNSTIAQFQAYSGYEHEVMPQLSKLFDTLSSAEFAKALADGAQAGEGVAYSGETPGSEGTSAAGTLQNLAGTNGEAGAAGEIPTNATDSAAQAGSVPGESMAASGQALESGNPAASANNAVANVNAENNSGAPESLSAGNAASASEQASASGKPSESGSSASVNSAGNASQADSANEASTAQNAEFLITKDGFIDASSGKPISFEERWTLTPEQLQKPGELEKVYDRLHKDLTVLESAIKKAREKNPDEDTPLGKMLSQAAETAKKLLDNLDFMNVLNRYFPYIQLPMRMEEKFTNGELYVYTKKGGGKKDGEAASVLLHLDMEAIGSTDVFLSLTGTQLKTKFYLADEDIENLFKEHITELTDRIEKLGLNVDYEFLPQKEAEQPVHDFLTSPEAVSMKRYRFDRRA